MKQVHGQRERDKEIIVACEHKPRLPPAAAPCSLNCLLCSWDTTRGCDGQLNYPRRWPLLSQMLDHLPRGCVTDDLLPIEK